MHSEKYIGTVIFFSDDLGYGFIARANEKDLFVHWSDIAAEGFKTLKKGQEVAFSIGVNKSNQPKAVEVVVINAEKKQ